MEVATDAGALCTGAGGRARGYRTAQVWEGEVIPMKRKEVLIAVVAGCCGAVSTWDRNGYRQ